MKRIDKIMHRMLFGATYTKWIPGEIPPAPMTEEMMLKAYRSLVDAGVVKYGEEVWIETKKQKEIV
jgi:hypothetical protein